MALAGLGLGLSAAGCETKNLHASHGLRYRDMQIAQAAARGAHEPAARGEEAVRAVQMYYVKKLSPSQNGGGAPAGLVSTAGVSPLH